MGGFRQNILILHTLRAFSGTSIRNRRRAFGGYLQWVLDATCEVVEWPYQPPGFDSLALRSALGPEQHSPSRRGMISMASQVAF